MGCSSSKPQQRPMPAFKVDIKSGGIGQHHFDPGAAADFMDKGKKPEEAAAEGADPPAS